MSQDERLRAIERRSRTLGSGADVVRVAREKARAGLLSEEDVRVVDLLAREQLSLDQLELAAYLGEPLALDLLDHDAVRLAAQVGDEAAVHVVLREEVTFVDLAAWLPGLALFGPTLYPRALLAGSRLALVGLDVHVRGLPPPNPAAGFVEQWYEETNDREAVLHAIPLRMRTLDAARARLAGDRSQDPLRDDDSWIPSAFSRPFEPASTALALVRALHVGASPAEPLSEHARRWSWQLADARPATVSAAAVLRAVVDELRPWGNRPD